MSTTHTLPARSIAPESQVAGDPTAHRVLSGDRPTGALHLGHYLGTLANRVRLQDAGLPVVLVIADYQVITDRDFTGSAGDSLRDRVRSLVADYLACGIDPDRTVIFPHSAVPALNQLMLPFLSLVTDAELRRNPTVKAELQESKRPLSGLLLTYPIHQAADILFCDADLVPVGKDQLPHLEVSRLIARRFNDRYGPTFTEPQALLSPAPLVLGTDGRKMSKSAGNTIPLGATEDATAQSVPRGPHRRRTEDHLRARAPAGDRSLLTIAALCRGERQEDVAETIGDGGAAELKRVVTEAVNEHLRPIRERRREVMADIGFLDGVLLDGTAAATAMAADTLSRVRAAMGMDYSVG